MPVPVSEIERAARPLTERVLEVLRAQPDQAFSAEELWAYVQGFTPPAQGQLLLILLDNERKGRALVPLREALGELQAGGLVRCQAYKGQPYYSLARP